MAWELSYTVTAHSQLEHIQSTAKGGNKGLLKQVLKALTLLAENPKHPGLNSHRYSSIVNIVDPTKPVWESYAQNNTPGAYRVFWYYGPGKNEITILAITPHP